MSVAFVETPSKIVDLMVKLITKRKDEKILDSGCGKGKFIEGLIKNGFKNLNGIELDAERFKYCSNRFSDSDSVLPSFFNADFLSWRSKEKYGVIIGNPPYVHYNDLPKQLQRGVSNIAKSMESDIYYVPLQDPLF